MRARWWVMVPVVGALTISTVLGSPPAATASSPGEPGRIAWDRGFEIAVTDAAVTTWDEITHDGGTYIATIPWGDESRDIHTRNFGASWLPSGDRLAYLHQAALDRYELRTIAPDGTSMVVVSDDWPGTVPTWSPDASRMAFGTAEGVWVADGDGSNRVLVGPASTGQWPNGPGVPSTTVAVAWSPAGDRLAFVEWSGGGFVAGNHWVSIMDPDGTDRIADVCVGHWVDIDWHPSGTELLCAHDEVRNTTRVSSMGAVIEADVALADEVVWSPDGRAFLYAVHSQTTALWRYDMVDGTHELVTPAIEAGRPAWQARRGRFCDDEDSAFQDEIEWLAAQEITLGCNPPHNDMYCPMRSVSRAEMAAFVLRASGQDDTLPAHQGYFVDVPEGAWYRGYVERLYELGLTTGCATDPLRYCPNDPVLRREMVPFLIRALGEDGSLPPYRGYFVDVPPGHWSTGYVEHAFDLGMTHGCATEPLRFCPGDPVSREQMAAFIYRTYR